MKQFAFALLALCLLCCKSNEKNTIDTTDNETTTTVISIDCSNHCEDETVTSDTKSKSIPEPPKEKIVNQNTKVKPQNIFKFSNEESVQLMCLQNTKVTFLPNSFIYADSGKPVKGKVKVVVKEFYKPSDIIKSKLTTQTKDGLLETRGMVHITATAHGKPCKLKPGKNIKLDFPTKKFETGFSYFKGEENGSNNIIWTEGTNEANRKAFKRISPRIINVERKKVNVSISAKIGTTPTYPKNEFDNWFVKQFIANFKDASLQGYKEEKRGKFYVFTKTLPFDFDTGEFKGIKTSNVAISTGYLPQIKKILNNSPQNLCYDNLTRNKKYRSYIKINVWADIQGEAEISRFKKKYNFSNDIQFEDSITIYADDLAWINVDRFLKYKPEELDDFIVSIGPNDHVDVKLVYHDFNAYITGTQIDNTIVFENIPKDKTVTIMATKKKNGKNYFAFTETKTSSSPFNLHFEKYSKTKFEKQLRTLDKI